MNLLKQEKPQCLLYSLAMLLDTDPSIISKIIGHDGLEVWFPLAIGNSKYRGIHPQEIIDYLYTEGKSLIRVENYANCAAQGCAPRMIYKEGNDRLSRYMNHASGIIILPNHAVAWDHNELQCYDPNGEIYELDSLTGPIMEFWFLINL